MPWDIDYALLLFTQLKKSKYHFLKGTNVTIETCLNLTSYLYDWEQSKLPKEYFINKYNTLSVLLKDYTHIKHIYEGEEKYGHLDLQKICVSSEVDYYIGICPDIYFSEYALTYMIEAAKQITSKYFTITPQVSKVGDADWDKIVNPKYMDIPYSEYKKKDVFDVRYDNKTSEQNIELTTLSKSKFAGWCDLWNKAFYEELCPLQDEWSGYGPWDYYSTLISDFVKAHGVDYQQYLLRGETIWMYPSGPLLENGLNGFSGYYRDMLVIKEVPNQRKEFESNMQKYITQGIEKLKEKNILPSYLHAKFVTP
jgi:hypothetical protein